MYCDCRLNAIVLVVASAFLVSRAAAAEPRNLITNGGFEEGLAGWMADSKQSVVTGPGIGALRQGMPHG